MATEKPNLDDVCLAVSSFRNDDAVLRLVERLAGKGPFHSLIVVDSQGTGAVPEELRQRRYPGVSYVTFDRNLGSAGNLATRLELAAKTDARFVYAVNHDGDVDPREVAALRDAARSPSIGAVFPLRRMSGRDGRYDVTGRLSVPVFTLRVRKRPRATVRVHWSSSNGALYNLEPARRGVLPFADLWMGWEDLGYGWLLENEGYEQLLVAEASANDPYEYRRAGGIWITDKAPWYAYYFARNFIIVANRTEQAAHRRAAVFARVLAEFAVTVTLRDRKRERLAYLTAGVRDGIAGRAGKWKLP